MRRTVSFIAVLICVIVSALSCDKPERKDFFLLKESCDVYCLCFRLNQNVLFYESLVRTYNENGSVGFLSMEYGKEKSVVYSFSFDSLEPLQYSVFSDKDVYRIPQLSFFKEGNTYYWEINGREAKDKEGNRVALNNGVRKPMFKVVDYRWLVSWNGRNWQKVEDGTKEKNVPHVSFSSMEDFLVCDVNDTLQLIIPTNDLSNTLKQGVPNQGFYKDVFMDAGVYLTTRNTLAAATYLGYSLESVSCTEKKDTLWQNTVIAGSEVDENGRLLYPDGAPRYRLLFVCGGSSKSHGKSLRKECRERMKDFVRNGGSYVGTCAGAFFASNGYDSICDYPYYLGLWPGMVSHTGLKQTPTGMFVDSDSPLLKYYDFGGDNYIKDIRHNKGGRPSSWPEGTELLACYDYPPKESMHGQPSAWAYKKNRSCGRVVMEGSHPEEVASGERRDFTAAMLRYASDGVGKTQIKGLLRNGEVRVMDKTTGDKLPEYTRIGDLQYHHFAVYIPRNAKNIRFSISSDFDCNLQLTLNSSTYAYRDIAEYVANEKGANQKMYFENMSEGLWYVAVQCLTTVSSTEVSLGQEYSGQLDVLNGIPYTLQVIWE